MLLERWVVPNIQIKGFNEAAGQTPTTKYKEHFLLSYFIYWTNEHLGLRTTAAQLKQMSFTNLLLDFIPIIPCTCYVRCDNDSYFRRQMFVDSNCSRNHQFNWENKLNPQLIGRGLGLRFSSMSHLPNEKVKEVATGNLNKQFVVKCCWMY